MNEVVKAFPDLFLWLIGVLATGGLGLLIYFVRENISVLRKLNHTVNDILIKFAVHEENNSNLHSNVEKLDGRVDRHDEDIETLKIDVHGLKDKIKKYD